MGTYRVVVNEQTARFRIEKRGLLGWSFVTDAASGDYLSFAELVDAEAWICAQADARSHPHRRWKVVTDCAD
jgi:hypothetical protein